MQADTTKITTMINAVCPWQGFTSYLLFCVGSCRWSVNHNVCFNSLHFANYTRTSKQKALEKYVSYVHVCVRGFACGRKQWNCYKISVCMSSAHTFPLLLFICELAKWCKSVALEFGCLCVGVHVNIHTHLHGLLCYFYWYYNIVALPLALSKLFCVRRSNGT